MQTIIISLATGTSCVAHDILMDLLIGVKDRPPPAVIDPAICPMRGIVVRVYLLLRSGMLRSAQQDRLSIVYIVVKGVPVMERVGLVVAVKDEMATVSLQRHTACEGCGRCAAFIGQQPEHRVEVFNSIRAGIGQRIVVEIDDRQMIKASFLLYLFPLAVLIGGIFFWLQFSGAFGYTGNQELPAVGIGFALMALTYFLIRLLDRRIGDNPRYRATITGFAPEDAIGGDGSPNCDSDR